MSVAKQFEKNIKQQILDSGNICIRLFDPMGGMIGVANVCDFVTYKNPILLLLELKTTESLPSLPIANISKTQYNGLLDASKYNGVIAGVLIWWVKFDICRFLSIAEIDEISKTRKSIPHNTDKGILLSGRKLRSYFVYDIDKFFIDVTKKYYTGEVENDLIQQR